MGSDTVRVSGVCPVCGKGTLKVYPEGVHPDCARRIMAEAKVKRVPKGSTRQYRRP